MQLPIDVKEVMKAAADIDEARQVPIHVLVLTDPSAPEDLVECAQRAFVTTAENAQVDFQSYPEKKVTVPAGCDLVVLIAGFSELTGPLASSVRRAKCPVVTLTNMPDIVNGLADATRKPLLTGDCIAPEVVVDEGSLPPEADFNQEPLTMSDARIDSLRARLGSWMVDTFKEKRLALALCFDCMRRPLALEFVNATAIQNAGIGAVMFIPGADMPIMTANQAKMLLQIAAAYGQSMGAERLKELAGVVGGAFAMRSAARQVVGMVPVGGWAVKGGIGYAGTQAMGHAAIAYFEQLTGERSIGENVSDAAFAAKEAAAHVADTFMHAHSPQEGIATIAREYFGTFANNAKRAARETAPQIRAAAPAVRNAVESVADLAGVDVEELAQRAMNAAFRARKK